MATNLIEALSDVQKNNDFSGSLLVKDENTIIAENSYGYANRSELVENNSHTRFGIASGCKLFTSIAICQLAEKGKLSFETKLVDCLNVSFPHFDKNITIHQLLTHTAGIPDYFDEEVMDDFEELWVQNPMYRLRTLDSFLPLFQTQSMKFTPGEKFLYNNAGYILLGLIVEQATGMPFTDYVVEKIFKPAGMVHSGYFEFDSLPQNTALGYIDFPDGTWKTNIYSLPVKGGSDGGAFITVQDMARLWDALLKNRVLSEEYTLKLLTPHIANNENSSYGYGVWIQIKEDSVQKYHLMGYDPGVSFHSAFYPGTSTIAVICSNKSKGAYDMMTEIEKTILKPIE